MCNKVRHIKITCWLERNYIAFDTGTQTHTARDLKRRLVAKASTENEPPQFNMYKIQIEAGTRRPCWETHCPSGNRA